MPPDVPGPRVTDYDPRWRSLPPSDPWTGDYARVAIARAPHGSHRDSPDALPRVGVAADAHLRQGGAVPFPRRARRPGNRLPVVTVIQAYVPAYRVPFFDELARQLGAAGWRLQVLHGEPDVEQARRGDARVGAWSVPIRLHQLHAVGHVLSFRRVFGQARRSDIVIAELASTNLDTYVLALLLRRRLMLWGHGRAYVTEPSTLDSWLELWLARRAHRVFVYTEGGAEYLRSHGYDPSRLTVVHNSTDTVALRAAAAALSEKDLADFRSAHDIGEGPIASFVGSYDESKLLPLLFDAAALVYEAVPGFTLLVAGAGPLQNLVDERAQRHIFVRSLPRADTGVFALIGRVSSCIVIPGRVGLVAVDALALGLPVVTTTYPRHAPEYEYLSEATKFVADANAADLARLLTGLLAGGQDATAARKAAYDRGSDLSVQAMAAAFSQALLP
jgi:glycosyltransferase involved in cell wall biosynthesis